MMANFFTKIFGSRNDRLLKQYRKTVEAINALEPACEALSDQELQGKTAEFKTRLTQGESLNHILPEAFAVVREASKRVLGMRHFDVQLIGGMVIHQGKIAEMGTGEGKTLMSTLPVYLNALEGKGVHLVTVNDYLARRDAHDMGILYKFLGLSVGVSMSNASREEKQAAYNADVTYATNNEYGFDYLRDNMVYEKEQRVQRGLNFAIVDEVDSILIDEARTPLIISGQSEDQSDLYLQMNQVAPMLKKQIGEANPRTGEGVIEPGDFTVDEKSRSVTLTDQGYEKAEEILSQRGLLQDGSSLYAPQNIILIHHLYAALRAYTLFFRDQHYVVQNGQVIIVDEFTGRLMDGRRWSDGLHQAVEAKEGVALQAENQTMASITFQNFFRMYEKLSGMTGTADTEAYEFQSIYGLETVIIPPNKRSQRTDYLDRVYKTSEERYEEAIKDIKECYGRGQPVLVGTASIENSEFISAWLNKEMLPHQVLNAKQHEREADVIAQAGRPKMITIATNMAGRGTDIVLGGNVEKEIQKVKADETLTDVQKELQIQKMRIEWQLLHDQVVSLGGLHIVATERHESRRIDNQLRGRAGRQGDPGSSRFYISLEDQLMRIFAGDTIGNLMGRLKIPRGEPIEARMVTRSIETAQRKVESHNFDMRKQLLDYDDVANEQRKAVYGMRNSILDDEDITDLITDLREEAVRDLVRQYVPEQSMEEMWDLDGLEKTLQNEWGMQLALPMMFKGGKDVDDEDVLKKVSEAATESFESQMNIVGKENFMPFVRAVLLQTWDENWRDHLSALDFLRQGIHLRGYAQKQPKQEYKREAFQLFETLVQNVRNSVTQYLLRVRVQLTATEEQENDSPVRLTPPKAPVMHNLTYTAPTETGGVESFTDPETVFEDKYAGVGRNDPCPCGSGKKFKQCHGRLR
ncbi:MAG: preprotein translocase subunit SecA [Saezia sp.]